MAHIGRYKIMLGYEFQCECGESVHIPFVPPFRPDSILNTIRTGCKRCNRIYKFRFSEVSQIPSTLKKWYEDWEKRFGSLFDESVRLSDILQIEIDPDQ